MQFGIGLKLIMSSTILQVFKMRNLISSMIITRLSQPIRLTRFLDSQVRELATVLSYGQTFYIDFTANVHM